MGGDWDRVPRPQMSSCVLGGLLLTRDVFGTGLLVPGRERGGSRQWVISASGLNCRCSVRSFEFAAWVFQSPWYVMEAASAFTGSCAGEPSWMLRASTTFQEPGISCDPQDGIAMHLDGVATSS